jgi:hypothetical protein
VGTSRTAGRKSLVERYAERLNAAQPKQEAPSKFRKIVPVDGKNYSITMPLEAYRALENAIEMPDESVPFENVLHTAMLLFMNYVDAATTVSESCGGGGSTPSNWGKDKDEDERDWARRCANHANWLCKPMARSVRRNTGYHR